MKSINILILFLGVLMFSCNTPAPKSNPITDMYPEEQEQIKNIVNDIFDVAKAKDMNSLDSYHLRGPKFTKFDDGDVSQMQDYAMAKKTEEEFFTATSDFDYTLPEVKVDVFDDVAIASFILDYSVVMGEDTFTGKSRSSLVFVKDQGQWKIAHEHFSPYIEIKL